MGELREIVDAEAVGRWFALLAVAGPLAGALIGALAGKDRRRGARTGFLIGLVGPLNWLLWRVYNALTDRIGLDRVSNVVINLILFVAVGAAIGIWLGRKTRPGDET